MTGYIAAAAVLSGLIIRSEYEKKHFLTEHYTVCSDKLKGPDRNFVFLSDLHNNEFGEGNRILIEEIDRIKPDAVLIGGDMFVSKGGRDPGVVAELLRNLASRYPVYYGNGNHEERMRDKKTVYGSRYKEFVNLLGDLGVFYLSDQNFFFGSDIRITGCNLEQEYYSHRFTVPKLRNHTIENHVGSADRERFQILLMHSPLFFKDCRNWGADLTLSGHFHGGTIRLPLLGGVMTPQYQFFLPYCAGEFKEAGQGMIVSRGLGTHSINIRLNDRPQLVWVSLQSK